MLFRSLRICFALAVVCTAQLLTAEEITFGVPARLDAPVSSAGADFGSGISPSGDALLFNYCPSFQSHCDIYVAERNHAGGSFEGAKPLAGEINTSANELYPSLSPDGLQLYFADALFAPFDNQRRRPGSRGGDIWIATRTRTNDEFATVSNLAGDVNSASLEAYPHVSQDGLTMLFSSNRRGGQGSGDLYLATRDSLDADFGNVMNLGPDVNSSANEGRATMSADGLTLFFDSDRDSGLGNFDLWMATRTDRTEPFGNVRNLGSGVNTSTLDSGPSLSADGSALYFESFRSPNHGLGSDLWRVSVHGISPPANGDLNRDGVFDSQDIDLLTRSIRDRDSDEEFDLNADGTVDLADHRYLVNDLRNTWIGDVNLDDSFDSGDLIGVFQVGQYEDAHLMNSGWADGDWNGDGEFDSGDLVLAFQDGGYEQGPRHGSVRAVPEPGGLFLLGIGILALCVRYDRSWMRGAPDALSMDSGARTLDMRSSGHTRLESNSNMFANNKTNGGQDDATLSQSTTQHRQKTSFQTPFAPLEEEKVA